MPHGAWRRELCARRGSQVVVRRLIAYPTAIDGCDVDCTLRTLQAVGLGPSVHVVITELGIEKARIYGYPEGNVCRTVDAVIAALPEGRAGSASCSEECCTR